MKRFFNLFCFLLIISVVVSCDVDDEESDMANSSDVEDDLFLAAGTVVKTDDSFRVQLDSDTILKMDNEDELVDLYDNDTRVLLYYSMLDTGSVNDDFDLYVDVYSMDEILIKSILEINEETSQQEIDSIGNDSISIVDTWITNDYLNVQFEYLGYDKTHYMNLVYDENNPYTDGGDLLLELHHNANNDSIVDYLWGVISFDISDFKNKEVSSINIQLRALNGNGEYEYTDVITYAYNVKEINTKSKLAFGDFYVGMESQR